MVGYLLCVDIYADAMRICHITNGGSWHLLPWIDACRQGGHEIHLVSPRWEGFPRGAVRGPKAPDSVDLGLLSGLNGVKLHVLPALRNKALSFAFHLGQIYFGRLIENINPDIIHSHQVFPYGLYASLSRFHPHVTTAFGSEVLIHARRSRIRRWLTANPLTSADAITVDSEMLRQAVINLGGKASHCHLIHFGVDRDVFNPVIPRKQAREQLQLQGYPIILSPRLLMSNYNIDVILRSVPIVRKHFPNVLFLIKFGYGNLKEECESLVRTLEISDHVRFIGYVPDELMPLYYRASDVAVSIPSFDSAGRSNFEAMACDLPAIVSNLPWVDDIEHTYGANFIRLKRITPDDTADAIVRALRDKLLSNQLRKNNRHLLDRFMDRKIWCKKMLNLYNKLAINPN